MPSSILHHRNYRKYKQNAALKKPRSRAWCNQYTRRHREQNSTHCCGAQGSINPFICVSIKRGAAEWWTKLHYSCKAEWIWGVFSIYYLKWSKNKNELTFVAGLARIRFIPSVLTVTTDHLQIKCKLLNETKRERQENWMMQLSVEQNMCLVEYCAYFFRVDVLR